VPGLPWVIVTGRLFFYFSIFHLKVADIDPGAMIARMQPRLYRTGDTVAPPSVGHAIARQSYLLALWAFTYVGTEIRRIFE